MTEHRTYKRWTAVDILRLKELVRECVKNIGRISWVLIGAQMDRSPASCEKAYERQRKLERLQIGMNPWGLKWAE
jgi:hypothetical protein